MFWVIKVIKFLLSILVAICLFFINIQLVWSQESEGLYMSESARKYIVSFRNNELFRRPSTDLVVNRQIKSGVLNDLGKELESGTSEVREQIVLLLVDIGIQTNTMEPNDHVLHNRDVLKILSTAGLAKADLGLGAAARELRNRSLPSDLAIYGEYYTEALNQSTDSDLLLLVAKAKPASAKGIIEKIAKSSSDAPDLDVRIAQAALGDAAIEDEFIAEASLSKTGADLANALKDLGFIGTKKSLRAVASYLRTPLKITREGSYERTVRLNAIEALAYNFRDQSILYRVRKPQDYQRVEEFCARELGINFDGPIPDFIPDRVFPRPIR